jgi:hypothetical protein
MAITHRQRAKTAVWARLAIGPADALDLVRSAASTVKGGGASLLTTGIRNLGAQIVVESASDQELNMCVQSAQGLVDLCRFAVEARRHGERTVLRVGGLSSYGTTGTRLKILGIPVAPLSPKGIHGFDPYRRFLDEVAVLLQRADPSAEVVISTAESEADAFQTAPDLSQGPIRVRPSEELPERDAPVVCTVCGARHTPGTRACDQCGASTAQQGVSSQAQAATSEPEQIALFPTAAASKRPDMPTPITARGVGDSRVRVRWGWLLGFFVALGAIIGLAVALSAGDDSSSETVADGIDSEPVPTTIASTPPSSAGPSTSAAATITTTSTPITTTSTPFAMQPFATYEITDEVNLRAGPATNQRSILVIPPRTRVPTYCSSIGEPIYDPYSGRMNNQWDFVTYQGSGGYVSDVYVNTQADLDSGRRLPPCP